MRQHSPSRPSPERNSLPPPVPAILDAMCTAAAETARVGAPPPTHSLQAPGSPQESAPGPPVSTGACHRRFRSHQAVPHGPARSFRHSFRNQFHHSPVTSPSIAAKLPNSDNRSEEHTSELQSLMRISYAVFCLKKKTNINNTDKKTRIIPKPQ